MNRVNATNYSERTAATDFDMMHDSNLASVSTKSETRPEDITAQWVALLAALTVSLTTLGISLANNPSGWFSLHPPLMALGILTATYGILTLQVTADHKNWAAGLQKHQWWMFVSSTSMIAGTIFIFYNKYAHSKAHFTSWHGLAGIITMGWSVIQAVIGAGSVWYDGIMFGGPNKARKVWKYHRVSGYLIYTTFSVVSYLGGAWSFWSIRNSPYWLRFFVFSMCIPAMLIAVLYRVRVSKLNFTR